MDMSAAFLKRMTLKEIAKETGDTLRSVQFGLPAADVWIIQKLPGIAEQSTTTLQRSWTS
eukprot:12931149-Prorocentrum_lima.AAC.1